MDCPARARSAWRPAPKCHGAGNRRGRDEDAWEGPMAGLVGNIVWAKANAGAAAGLLYSVGRKQRNGIRLAQQLKKRVEIGLEWTIPAQQHAQRNRGHHTKAKAATCTTKAHEDLRQQLPSRGVLDAFDDHFGERRQERSVDETEARSELPKQKKEHDGG